MGSISHVKNQMKRTNRYHTYVQALKRNCIFCWMLLLSASCLDRIDLLTADAEPQLVVQGFVDNLGRVEVQLRASQNFTSFINEGILENAQVELIENDSITVQLTDFGDDTFLNTSEQLSLRIGNTYQLRITLSNDEVYESSIEAILPPIEILDGEARLAENRFLNKNQIEQVEYTHNISLELRNENEDQFFITDNSAFEQVQIRHLDDCLTPVPPLCWAIREVIVSSDITTGSNLGLAKSDYRVMVQEVPYGFKLEYVAIIRVQRMNLTQYNYWQDIQDQRNRPGSLFDREFSPIIGNIKQVNGSKVALGYFAAFGTSTKIVCFDRFDIPQPTNIPIDSTCSISCVDWFAPATLEDMKSLLCIE